MLFDSGVGKASFLCSCGKVHHSVSIGEESLACACGNVLTFREGENFFDYYWVKVKLIVAAAEWAINQDKRNLC